jgi:hypothetical protein
MKEHEKTQNIKTKYEKETSNNEKTLQQKFELLKKKEWSAKEITSHYGYANLDFIKIKNNQIDRKEIEKYISQNKRYSIKITETELCLDRSSILKMISNADKIEIPLPVVKNHEEYIIIGDMLNGWIQAITKSNTIWGSITTRATKLHQTIQKKIPITPLQDTVYKYFKDHPTILEEDDNHLAWGRCSVSNDPIDRKYSEYLNTSNGLTLDIIGWHILIMYPEFEQNILGSGNNFQSFKNKIK